MSDNTEFYGRIELHLREACRLARLHLENPTNRDILTLLQQVCLEQHRLVTVAAKTSGERRRGGKSAAPDPWEDMREP